MSRGPLPAEVYWRRRFLVLAAGLLIAWAVVMLWPKDADSKPSANEAAKTKQPVKQAPQTVPGQASKARETTSTVTTSGAKCDPETVRIIPNAAPDQTAQDEVRFQLVLSTTAERGCTFEPTPSSVLAVISTDGNPVWDSSVCRQRPLLTEPVQLSPRWSTTVDTNWSGRGSGPDCAKNEGWATPGKYSLRIGTLGGEPGKTSFQLTEKEKPATDDGERSSEADRDKSERREPDRQGPERSQSESKPAEGRRSKPNREPAR